MILCYKGFSELDLQTLQDDIVNLVGAKSNGVGQETESSSSVLIKIWLSDDTTQEEIDSVDSHTSGKNFHKDLDGPNAAGSPSFAGLALTELTQGSIPFVGADGVISQDSANLFWDNTNDRLGIAKGASGAPQYRLDIGELSYFAINGSFAHVVQHNAAAAQFWSIAPRNNGNFDIAVSTTDPRPTSGTISTSNNAISIKANKNVDFAGAVIFARMTTTQRNALTAINGMVVYNTTLNQLQGFINGSWSNL